jgi:hypothetical protein
MICKSAGSIKLYIGVVDHLCLITNKLRAYALVSENIIPQSQDQCFLIHPNRRMQDQEIIFGFLGSIKVNFVHTPSSLLTHIFPL